MNKTLISSAAIAVSLLFSSPVLADKPGTIGIGLGATTFASGLSGKYYMSDSFALQGAVGTYGAGADRFSNFGGIAVGIDGLVENSALTRNEIFSLDWNFGLGAGVGLFEDTLGLAVSGVVGLEFNFVPIPIDLVLEYRPGLLVVPDVGIELVDFSGHIRFYFQ